jgi:hypothetical protein
MPGKANARKRERIEQGRKKAAPEQALERQRKGVEELENAQFVATFEERSRITEQATMFVSNEDLDCQFENREP